MRADAMMCCDVTNENKGASVFHDDCLLMLQFLNIEMKIDF